MPRDDTILVEPPDVSKAPGLSLDDLLAELATFSASTSPSLPQADDSTKAPGFDSSPGAQRGKVARVVAGVYWVDGQAIARPVRVAVAAMGADGLVVSEPTTGIFGSGATLDAAIDDFRAALLEHRAVLEDSGPLSDDLRDQLEFLKRHLK